MQGRQAENISTAGSTRDQRPVCVATGCVSVSDNFLVKICIEPMTRREGEGVSSQVISVSRMSMTRIASRMIAVVIDLIILVRTNVLKISVHTYKPTSAKVPATLIFFALDI